MKRATNAEVPAFNDILHFALSYDEGTIALAPHEVQELLYRLAYGARKTLSRGSELRLGSVSMNHGKDGRLTVKLRKRQLSMQSECSDTKSSARETQKSPRSN